MTAPTDGLGINWNNEQEAFERWYLTTQCKNNHRRVAKHPEGGLYVDRVVRIAWRAWRHGVKRSAEGAGAAI